MIWFVINRSAGNGRGLKVWREVEQLLIRRGTAYGFRFTERPSHARELATELSGMPDTQAVAAVGGDGTVHEVASGLIGTSVALGCIPVGSGNDYARSVGIPAGWPEALERILRLESTPIDIGLLNEYVFVINSGVGFDGEAAKITNRSWYKRWLNRLGIGSFAYVVSMVRLLITYRPSDVLLDVDGLRTNVRNVWLITAANMPYYGGGMKICPDARHDDGLLQLCLVEDIGRLELLRFFPHVYNGTHIHHPAVKLIEGQRISIESTVPMTIHTDGEYAGETPAVISVRSGQLMVL